MKTASTVIGVDIGGTWIRVALVDETQLIALEVIRWPVGLSPAEEVKSIADACSNLAGRCGKADSVLAVGVSLAAMVDIEGTVVSWPNRPSWQALPFKALMVKHLGVPVTVEDDANAAALAEWRFGAGRGYQHLMVMMVGTGVGCGLILNGGLFRGQRGWAGELGHQVMLPDGLECPCGHRGCLQTVASGRALERFARARNLPDAAALFNASEEGQEWASEHLAICGSWLGLVAANVANLLDLEAVIVGGGLSGLSALWWDVLTKTFQSNLLNRSHRQVILQTATLAETAGIRGAASLAWQSVGARA